MVLLSYCVQPVIRCLSSSAFHRSNQLRRILGSLFLACLPACFLLARVGPPPLRGPPQVVLLPSPFGRVVFADLPPGSSALSPCLLARPLPVKVRTVLALLVSLAFGESVKLHTQAPRPPSSFLPSMLLPLPSESKMLTPLLQTPKFAASRKLGLRLVILRASSTAVRREDGGTFWLAPSLILRNAPPPRVNARIAKVASLPLVESPVSRARSSSLP